MGEHSMAKERLSAAALAEMIAGQMDGDVQITVAADPAYGWQPTVMASPARVHQKQQEAEWIARELRKKYDLDE
jgi:hypothetical protein